MELKDKINVLGSIIGVIIITILFLFYVNIEYSDEIDNINNAYMIESYVKKNNLSMPFPNNINYKDTYDIVQLYNLDIIKFHKKVIENYLYSKKYDCKYWSYVWLNWWKYHKDEYKVKIIRTDNHIFVMFYNDKEYYVADQNNLKYTKLT